MVAHKRALWLFVLAACGFAREHAMKLQRIEYLVADLPEYPQQLTITPHSIRYESHSNSALPAIGIGLYERAISEQEAEGIEAALDPVSLRSLPDHHGQVLSGDRWIRIRLISQNESVEKLIGTKLPVDPKLRRAIDRLDRLVDQTIQYPHSVLQVSLTDAMLDRDGRFSAAVMFNGAGVQEVTFNPQQNEAAATAGSLALYWWPYRAGVPKSDVHSAQVTDISPVTSSKPTDGLGTFQVHARIEPSSRPLVVQIRYLNMTGPVGMLFSSPVTLQ